jgi:DNA-binding transcriptional LysR family regulator
MWEEIELRELRTFLILVEELHFGRTAERLHVSPSRVSQSLRELEAKLGGRLVHRTTRSASLTPLGERFHARIDGLNSQLAAALQQTRTENSSLEGTLRLGLFSRPAGGPLLRGIIDAFEVHQPGCTVEAREVPFDDPFGPLTRGEIQAMATWLPHGRPDLVVGPFLNREPRVLAVAREHPLAKKSSVSVEDLADCRVPMYEQVPREMHEVWIPSKTPSGQTIPHVRVEMFQRDASQLALRIARGEFVHPTVPSAFALFSDAGVASVPIRDMPAFRSALVWRRRSSDPRMREFVRVARQTLRTAAS